MNADHCPKNCSLLVAPKATYEECDSPIVVTQGHFLSGAPYAVVMVELIPHLLLHEHKRVREVKPVLMVCVWSV